MDLQAIPLEPLSSKRVAVLGYGNQGAAQAQNLRDSGISVHIGLRKGGESRDRAIADGFEVFDFESAVVAADVVMFLLPDEYIGEIYTRLSEKLDGKWIGFAHGFSFVYRTFVPRELANHFLVGPKGAGRILRKFFVEGRGLPAVYAVHPAANAETEAVALAYAKAIGCAHTVLLKTTFDEETHCDLFGEQVVLCGSIPELLLQSFNTLVAAGYSKEMAWFECCFEARLILDIWLEAGPSGMHRRISPTASFGGRTRGKRIVGETAALEMGKILEEIRSGAFAKEWMNEVAQGRPTKAAARHGEDVLQEVNEGMQRRLS